MEGLIGVAVLLGLGGLLGLVLLLVWLVRRARQQTAMAAELAQIKQHLQWVEAEVARMSAQTAGVAPVAVPVAAPVTAAPMATESVVAPAVVAEVPRYPWPVVPPPAVPVEVVEASHAIPAPMAALFERREEPVAARAVPIPTSHGQTPHVPAAPVLAPARRVSLEERLGHNWLNRVGIVMLVVGLVLFLGYQLKNLGPAGKSATGAALGLVLLVGSVWLERRERYRVFARAGIGGGWALLFFLAFAMNHVDATRVIPSQGLDLVLMFAVATGMVLHSLRYQSQVVTSLAFLLGFVTVAISHVTLFSLLAGALLAAGVAVVAWQQAWFAMALLGMCAAYLNHLLWLTRVLPGGGQPGKVFPDFFASAGLVLAYWLMFRLLYVLKVPDTPEQTRLSHAMALLNTVGLLGLLKYQSSHPEWAFRGLLVLGVAEMVLAFAGRRRWRGSFVLLSTVASVLLLAAVPFRFGGAVWSLLWLLEAEVLLAAGLRLPESVFRRLGLIAGIVAGVQVVMGRVVTLTPAAPYGPGHLQAALVLFVAAAVLWLNAEYGSRRWRESFAGPAEEGGVNAQSYLAAGALVFGLWMLAGPVYWAWVAPLWMAAALTLGWAAGTLTSRRLAAQADCLVLAAVVRVGAVNFGDTALWHGVSVRLLTVGAVVVLLYVNARRTQKLAATGWDYLAVLSTWAAGICAATLAWYELLPVNVALAWAVGAVVLLETGLHWRRDYLRMQAYVLAAACFVRLYFANMEAAAPGALASSLLSPRLYTVVPLILLFAYVYERVHQALTEEIGQRSFERAASVASACMAVAATASLAYFEVRLEFVALAWGLLTVALLGLAWGLRRELFTQLALAMLAVTTVRVFAINLLSPSPLTALTGLHGWMVSRTGSVASVCVMLLLGLPACFALRRRETTGREFIQRGWRQVFARPEQAFFFVPLVLATLLLAVVLHHGGITLGWIALGVAAFLFALAVGERSFRLAGLALLGLGLGKIIFLDVWRANGTDRFITLIVTGAALLLVSYLYSRYRETILKLL